MEALEETTKSLELCDGDEESDSNGKMMCFSFPQLINSFFNFVLFLFYPRRMKIEYGPDYDEVILCLKYLSINADLIAKDENVLCCDGESFSMKDILSQLQVNNSKTSFEQEDIALINKIFKMNADELKVFYSNISKTKVNDKTPIPFTANKKTFTIADIFLYAKTYRYLYNTIFDEQIMSHFNFINNLVKGKLDTILFTNFEYLDIRVGRIIEIKDHPEADKLYIETVMFDKPRVIVSGLRDHFKKEDLLNKSFLFLVNLKKNKLKGVVSEGMILCAKNEILEVLTIDGVKSNAAVLNRGTPVIREVSKPLLDASKDKFKKIMQSLTILDYHLCYEGKRLAVDGKEIKTGIREGMVS